MALMLVPGPNVALIVANSLAFGAKTGLVTVLGTVVGMIVQLSVAALGVAALFGALAQGFATLRWLGVAYLLRLGVRDWRAPAGDLSRTRPVSPRRIFVRGFLVSLTNPKPLVFYAAFLPQFLVADTPLDKQMAVLSATFVTIALIVDSGWALAPPCAPAISRTIESPNPMPSARPVTKGSNRCSRTAAGGPSPLS